MTNEQLAREIRELRAAGLHAAAVRNVRACVGLGHSEPSRADRLLEIQRAQAEARQAFEWELYRTPARKAALPSAR